MVERKAIEDALAKVLEEKGKRKFAQSVDMAVNFKGVDFNKQESRLNVEVVLPKGRGYEVKTTVFADGQLATDARKVADLVMPGEEIPKLAADRARLKQLASTGEFLAQPNLMVVVGKHLGQFLGTRGKLPRPVVGDIKAAVERAKKTIRIRTKGKYLPTLHCAVGSENMGVAELADNAEKVLEDITAKTGPQSIKSVLFKLSMGKPVRV